MANSTFCDVTKQATSYVLTKGESKMSEQNRQGDLLFVRLDKLPEKKEDWKDGKILVRGEATGHAHALESLTNCDVFLSVDGKLIINVKKGTKKVLHEDHGTVILHEGAHEVKRKNEYLPSGWQQVKD